MCIYIYIYIHISCVYTHIYTQTVSSRSSYEIDRAGNVSSISSISNSAAFIILVLQPVFIILVIQIDRAGNANAIN